MKKLILLVLGFCITLSPVLGATVSWSTGTEWDNAVSQSNIIHESVANTDHNNEGNLKKSYSAENPYMTSYLNNYWAFDENSGGTAVDISGASGELNGIDIGYDSGNLNFHANQWDGSSNQGEIDITCSGGDSNCEFTRSGTTYSGSEVQDINWGVATDGQDKGTQYIMYSAESVHTRFSNAHNSNADHFIGVNYDNGWEYDGNNNNGDTSFSPQSSDILIAEYNGEASADSGNEGDINYVSEITGDNGVATGGVTQGEQGLLGTSSYDFDGSSDVSVNVSHNPVLNDLGLSQYTTSAWVNLDSYLSGGSILVSKTSNELFMHTEIRDGGAIRIGHEECDSADYYSAGGDVGTGNWVMITTVKTDSAYVLYKNGQKVFSYSYGGNPCDTNADLTIGGGHFTGNRRPIDGNIDDVRIYDSALSQQEVAELYNIYADESSLTTLSKTFSEPRDMGSLQLTNLDYSLNGEQIEVVVETNQGERSNPIALDGSNSYDVTGLSTEADTFNLEININSNDVTSTPVVRSVGLSGDEANDPPNVNGPVNPTDNEDPAALDPNLEVDVDDPDGDSLDVTFYEGSPGSNALGTVSASSTNNAVLDSSNHNLGSSPGSSYSWSVRVDDNNGGVVDSSTWSFTTIGRPDAPSNPGPQDGVSSVSTSQDLNVDVEHPDGIDMHVDFYLDRDGDGNFETSLTDNNVPDGGTASVSPSLSSGTEYSWYARARTAGYDTSERNAGTWSFTTNAAPTVEDVSKTDSPSNHAFETVTAIVSDQDGAGDISSATLTVDDGVSSNTYSSNTIDTSYEGSNQAKVTFGPVSYNDDSQWGVPDYMDLEAKVTDSEGNTGSNSVKRYFPNHAPTTDSNFSYSESPQNHAFTLNVDAQDVDDGAGEIDTCTVEHRLEAGNETSESGTLNQGETATCSFTIDDSYAGYDKGDSIEHRVTFQDLHGASATTDWASHTIPNSPPSATDLRPDGDNVTYEPVLNATYNDPDGDNGSLTFYNTSSGEKFGTVNGLAPGEHGTVDPAGELSPGTTYNFTVEASDGLNATNATENFTTIYRPDEPYDPFPEDGSVVDTTTRSDDEIAASVKVVQDDGHTMNVEFVNASDDSQLGIDFDVDSGSRAKLTNLANSLRDESNTTYRWYARATDQVTGETVQSETFEFKTVEVGEVMFDVRQGEDGDNMDITGQSNNGWTSIEFEVTSSQVDPIPLLTVNETDTGDVIKSWSDVDNNSVLSVNLDQDDSPDWNLDIDSEYEYFIEASEGPNVIGQSLNHTIYTYNVSLDWNRAERYYDVYQYDIYRAQDTGDDLTFDYGDSGNYDLVGSLPETSFNDSGPGLETGTFCWKVAASNPSGSSDAIPVGDGECRTLN